MRATLCTSNPASWRWNPASCTWNRASAGCTWNPASAGFSTVLVRYAAVLGVWVLAALSVAAHAQQQPSVSDVHEFEAASIKPNHSGEEIGRIVINNGGLLRATNVNTEAL